jgi:UDP-N-acetylmuramyl pentapeptide synthase
MAGPPEIRLTTEWVARAMGATARPGDPDREFNGVSIDHARAALAVFFSVRGGRFGGADFAGQRSTPEPAGLSWSADASDSGKGHHGRRPRRRGRRRVAALQVCSGGPAGVSAKVVAITGSAGRVTTKSDRGVSCRACRVVRNRNFNNHIGLPLSLIELRRRRRFWSAGDESRRRNQHAGSHRRT